MRKGIGAFLLIVGGLIFTINTYLFMNYMTSMDKARAHFERNGLNPDQIYKEGFAEHFKTGRMVTGVVLLLGLGVALGGFWLYKKK